MRKSAVRLLQSKNRSRSRTASEDLIKSISKVFPDKKVPVAVLTGLAKKYSKRTIDPNSSFIRRLSADPKDPKNISAVKLSEYLSENTTFQRGQQLSQDAIKRAHAAFCNSEGKMTFQYILKRCEQLGVPMTQKVAKGIVRKYGKRKDHLTVEDCANVINRRYNNLNTNKRPNNSSNTPKKNRANTSNNKR